MRNRAVALGIVVAVLATVAAEGEWELIGPWGGRVDDVAVHPLNQENLVLASPQGIFSSTDEGETWANTSAGLPSSFVSAAVPDPEVEGAWYCGVAGFNIGGVYRSTDSGRTWASLTRDLTLDVRALAALPRHVLMATHYPNGIFRSSDGGSSWHEVTNPVTGVDREVKDFTASSAGFLMATFDGVFRSTNAGASWFPSTEGIETSVESLAVDPQDDDIVYASVPAIGVQKSTDGGVTWSAPGSGLENLAVLDLAVDAGNSSRLLAATGRFVPLATSGGVFLSTDAGASWLRLNEGLSSADVVSLDQGAWGVWFAATADHGVFARPSIFEPWEPRTVGKAYAARDFHVDAGNDREWAATPAGLHTRTTGEEWEPRLLHLSILKIEPYANDPSVLVALAREGIYRSTDAGATWQPTELDEHSLVDLVQSDGGYLVAAGHESGGSPPYLSGLWESTDGGAEWDFLSIGPYLVYDVSMDPRNPARMFATVSPPSELDFSVLRTDDGWRESSGADFGGIEIPAFPDSPTFHPYVPGVLYMPTNTGVGVSTDDGETWTQHDLGSAVFHVVAGSTSPGSVFASTGEGIFRSWDFGATWFSSPSEGLPDVVFPLTFSIARDPRDQSILNATSPAGVFRRKESVLFLDGFESGGTSAWSVP